MAPPRLLVTSLLAVTALTAASCAGGGGAGDGRLRASAVSAGAGDGDATDTADLPASFTRQSLDWSGCPAPKPRQGDDTSSPTPLPDGATWECATMIAPLDYAKPEGDTIGIALIRARASATGGERIGSLVFNFGGPGGSGVATLPAFGGDYAELHKRYDLVSFDPRGVGGSEGVRCLDDAGLDDYFAASPVPENDAERQRLTDRLKAFAAGCEKRAGRLLPHLTTASTARDLDLMRAVLGDDRLHYFGISYGTQLGGVYAHLFPQRLGRAVFDAVVDPTLTPEQSARAQAKGFQRALGNYLDACLSGAGNGDGDCPLGDSAEEATDSLSGLLDRLRDHPMRTQDPDGRRLTQSLAWNGIAQALYSQDFWAYLTQGLDDALADEAPDGTVLLAMGDAMNGRNPDGTYTTLQSALTAVSCADSGQRYTMADVDRALPRFRDASPLFGPPLAFGLLGCTHWPVAGTGGHPEVAAEGAPPILLIGTTGDPATPYEGTRRMKQALGDGVGVELTFEGEGHGAYNGGNDCVRSAADAYLLEGKVPEDGTTCD